MSAEQPSANPQSRLCLRFSVDGLDVYANREGLIDLRDQLTWLIDSSPEDFCHVHTVWTLENDESRFHGKRPRNAGVVITDDAAEMINADIQGGDCVDLSFFITTDEHLNDLQKQQR
ncbi:hypothetical protein [Novosphingobium sp.]|uniref:hypothetical protein n=1 Tax=Novosphingobium sp. TaxID=1874826 RepID=UPI00260FDF5C|nr:hypothetical protein [Novosphingobium sp.]